MRVFNPSDRVEINLLLHGYFHHRVWENQAMTFDPHGGEKVRHVQCVTRASIAIQPIMVETRLRSHGHTHFENNGD